MFFKRDLNDELLTAVYTENLDKVIKLLKKGADANWLDEDKRSILMSAVLAEKWNTEILRQLILNRADVRYAEPRQHWTALHFAARDGRPEIVKLLLENGAEVDAQDCFGDTPLWRAVVNFRGDNKTIHVLLSFGADKNIPNKSGVTPLSLTETIAYPGIRDVFEI